MIEKTADARIRQFIDAYFQSKEGTITRRADDVLTVGYPKEAGVKEYTFLPAVAWERKLPLLAPGSLIFEQIIAECQENGILCQIRLTPKGDFESLIKEHFKDSPFTCEKCHLVTVNEDHHICVKAQPCYHQINNGKIVSAKVAKKEPIRYFQFFYSVVFHNKLRPKSEDIMAVLVDEKSHTAYTEDFNVENILKCQSIEVQDFNEKIKPEVFKHLRSVAEEWLNTAIRDKAVLFDLPLSKEKKAKLRSFDKRLKKERHEHLISKKIDFDFSRWQANYQALMEREEESFITNIAVKFINLLIINTAKIKFEITLDNGATVDFSLTLGVDYPTEVTCPICRKTFTEGYATEDSLYVCGNCIRQSVDSGKIYSKKASLALDEKLMEYLEHYGGFVCSVCGKKFSRLLEFKCSHDHSSVCINHYDLCDICGKPFSKLNLTYTDEFKRQLCPKHAIKEP